MKTKATETKSKSTAGVAHLLTWIVCLGALILSCASAPAQNLFVSDGSGNIYELDPNGVRSTFASGLGTIFSFAFDKAGNLFVADSGNIYKITPAGLRSTFASGLTGSGNGLHVIHVIHLAVDSAGNLFVTTGDECDSCAITGDPAPINGSG